MLKVNGFFSRHKKKLRLKMSESFYSYLVPSPLFSKSDLKNNINNLDNSIMLDLMANCVLQLMVEDVYPADLAQLSYSLYASETGTPDVIL